MLDDGTEMRRRQEIESSEVPENVTTLLKKMIGATAIIDRVKKVTQIQSTDFYEIDGTVDGVDFDFHATVDGKISKKKIDK